MDEKQIEHIINSVLLREAPNVARAIVTETAKDMETRLIVALTLEARRIAQVCLDTMRREGFDVDNGL